MEGRADDRHGEEDEVGLGLRGVAVDDRVYIKVDCVTDGILFSKSERLIVISVNVC